MFLELAHTRLDIFAESKLLVLECYRLTKDFPTEEKFALTQQIRRAAISVHLNIAEGCSRKAPLERKRYFEISRGSIIEVDTAFDIALELDYIKKEQLQQLGEQVIKTFKLLSGLIKATTLKE